MSNSAEKKNTSTETSNYLKEYLCKHLGTTEPPEDLLKDLTLETVAKYLSENKSKYVKPESEMSISEWLQHQKNQQVKNRPPQILDELSLEGVARFIKKRKCQNIITLAGAGISTSAGIPDFRSPRVGLYDNLQEYDLPNHQAIFDIEYFKKNQEPFYRIAKEMWPGNLKPTVCHYFIRLLHEKGLLLRHYTQNIDSLEFTSGLDAEKIIEAHGTFRFSHCIDCNKAYHKDWIEEKVFSGVIPKCEVCGGPVKPDIVFFGEELPDRFQSLLEDDLKKCDLLIILGTSLVVQPFASVMTMVTPGTPRLYINLEKASATEEAGLPVFGFGGGFLFDDPHNYRDVFWKGTCDSGCKSLASLIGWKSELEELIKEHSESIEKQIALNKKRREEGKSLINKQKSDSKSEGDKKRSVGVTHRNNKK